MLKKYAPSLQINTKPSRILGFIIAVIHILAILASAVNSLPIVIKLLIILVVIINFWFSWKQYILNSDPYILKHTEAKGWELIDAKQQVFPVSIAGSSVSTTLITILDLQHNGRLKHTKIVVRDSVDAEDYRRLRVKLKISRLK